MPFADTNDKYKMTQTAGLVAAGGTPTIAVGAGLDLTGTATISTGTRDCFGLITLLAAGTPAVSTTVATLSFSFTLDNAPTMVQMEPANAAASALSGTSALYVDSAAVTATGFAIKSGAAAIVAGTTYKYWYMVVQ